MPAKKIWIMSKYPWVATLRSLSGDAGWFSLSKYSGEANYPTGETIDVIVNDISHSKEGYVDVLSNSTTISVFVKLMRTCVNAYSHAYSRAYNCTSPESGGAYSEEYDNAYE